MDDKINDFLNEINEIAPPQSAPQEEEWKECFDKLTGYVYYWNRITDKVTWSPPESFKKATDTSTNIVVNPKPKPLFPSVNVNSKEIPKDIKIYSIGENSKISTPRHKKQPVKRPYNKGSDSEDEKIILISSYGSDSDSDSENTNAKKSKLEDNEQANNVEQSKSEDEDPDGLLSKIHKRGKELKAFSGEVAVEVKNVKSKKPEISLVAGYSDSEEENEELKSVISVEEQPQISHSTLFPITKPISIDDFKPSQPLEKNTKADIIDNFDNKAFQRKRRIGISLVNTRKPNIEINNDEEERKGLGFDKKETSNVTNENLVYQGSKKDGIMFIKSETLNLSKEVEKPIHIENNTQSVEVVNEMYSTLHEKLIFLNEGRPDISPVQSLVVKAETLFLAMNDGALKQSYLEKWLKETCSELIKLEKEATPSGWILQWDKSNKRYFYQNITTGESQWEYPQPDLGECDDSMDISTTPPHVQDETSNPLSPPLPPTIRSPTPPPPPIISLREAENNCKDVPLPKEPKKNIEPLPPGVDQKEKAVVDTSDPLNSALDSFYSDIAAISSSPCLPSTEETNSEPSNVEIKSESIKKKKKSKVKLAPGLVMKKKGVSKLVEKWKNLQQEYNN